MNSRRLKASLKPGVTQQNRIGATCWTNHHKRILTSKKVMVKAFETFLEDSESRTE